MLAELREAVRLTALKMFQAGLVVGTDGNVSARDPATGLIAITPTTMPYDQITADDVVIVDCDKKVIWGKRRPSWETPMHTGIHRGRANVIAVMHTHSTYATAFAVANHDLPPATIPIARYFGGTVRCAPYVRTGSEAMATVNLEYLGQTGRAILLGNHGTLCVATSLDMVLKLSIMLEQSARLIYLASGLGGPVMLPADEIAWAYEADPADSSRDFGLRIWAGETRANE